MRKVVLAVVISYPLALLSGCQARADWPDLRGRDTARQQKLVAVLDRIRREHPRIFCTEADIKAIQQRVQSVPEVREVWEWEYAWARSDHYYRNLWATPTQLQACVIVYRVANRDPRVLNHAVAIADFLSEAQGDGWTWPRIAKALAMAYDWLYEDLTPEQKIRYGRAAIHAAQQCYRTWRHSEFNNHLYLEYGPILYVGIALYEEGLDDAAARQLALDGYELLIHHMLPAHELVTQGQGGWHEGMSYHAFFTYEFAHLVELWSSATDNNLWPNFAGLDGDAEWLVHCTRPWDNGRVATADIGDYDSYDNQIAAYMPLLQQRKRDGVAGWWGEQIRQKAKRRHAAGVKYQLGDGKWWPYLLWYDPAVPHVPTEKLPLHRHFAGIGWVAMRSSWESDATFALFVCAPLYLGGHQHCDNNSFVIGKNAWLALDSGVYDAETPHRGRYYARTIAHNTITVTDPRESFAGGTWGYGQEGQGPNDGGQLYGDAPEFVNEVAEVHRRANIIAYQATDDYVFVAGDATRSYSLAKLKEFTRAFLYIRPDLFIIFDRVESTDHNFKKRWLLHSAAEPRIAASTTEIVNGNGRLVMQTLLPASVDIAKIGGPGHEFEVDGTNYPPKKAYDPDEAGRWRVEVSPTEPNTRDYFLHVLQTSDAVSATHPEVSVTQDEAGVALTLAHAAHQVVVRFTKEGPLTGSLTVSDRTTGKRLIHDNLEGP
ncbi:MAG: heparinase II/III domain-containing protein [Candidatus Zipacnadales bacterium]